ncbi:heterokaryon incompatibility protein-domain-containing protein [Xylariaceae sp. FL1019]|nr:heterokaryon incompatibility protein-domain-containing protein [Xylariaceae sp. FL1019]
METPSNLCDTCQAIKFDDAGITGGYASQDEGGHSILKFDEDRTLLEFDTGLDIRDSFPHFPLLSNSIAQNDCDCCRLLKTSILKGVVKNGYGYKRDLECRVSANYFWRSNNPVPGVSYEGLWALVIEIQLYEGQSSVQTWLRHRIIDRAEVLDPMTLEWIQSRLKSCPDCDKLPRDSFIPTRLLRVTHDSSYLVGMDEETTGIHNRDTIAYAALSYCWGAPDTAKSQLTTTKNTERERGIAISDDEMTSVLRDAIAVCRALSIPYLWIDALCIVQDSLEDWERESTQIGRIFSGAVVTICAWASESCLDSFLSKPKGLVIPFQSSIEADIRGTYTLTTGVTEALGSSTYLDMADSKWYTRGWTLQEQVMSKKILAFGSLGRHFICSHLRQTQQERLCFRPFFAQKSSILHPGKAEDLYRSWYNLIASQYAERLVTRATDRFPAISGIATMYQSVLNDKYVAGIWQRDLHRGLFWYISASDQRNTSWEDMLNQIVDVKPYIAPSWSWASRYHRLDFDHRPNLPYDDGLPRLWSKRYYNITPVIMLEGSDPHGRISSATLHITARSRKIQDEILVSGSLVDGDCIGYSGMSTKPQFQCQFDWGLAMDRQPLEKVSPGDLRLVLIGSIKTNDVSQEPLVSNSNKIEREIHEHSGRLARVTRFRQQVTVHLRNLSKRYRSALSKVLLFFERMSRAESGSHSSESELEAEDLTEEVDPDREEMSYGLIVYQLPDTANFIRVGVFHSAASDGWGLRLFEDCETVTLNLV